MFASGCGALAAAASIAAISSVVVVLPFVPVDRNDRAQAEPVRQFQFAEQRRPLRQYLANDRPLGRDARG